MQFIEALQNRKFEALRNIPKSDLHNHALERDEFIETVTGRGSFVASKNLEFIREEQFRRAEEHLMKTVDIARSSGIKTIDELIEILRTLYEEV